MVTYSSAVRGAGAPKRQRNHKERRSFTTARALPSRSRDLPPSCQNVSARAAVRRPSFRPLIGAPVASLRCRILRSGVLSINRAGRNCSFVHQAPVVRVADTLPNAIRICEEPGSSRSATSSDNVRGVVSPLSTRTKGTKLREGLSIHATELVDLARSLFRMYSVRSGTR